MLLQPSQASQLLPSSNVQGFGISFSLFDASSVQHLSMPLFTNLNSSYYKKATISLIFIVGLFYYAVLLLIMKAIQCLQLILAQRWFTLLSLVLHFHILFDNLWLPRAFCNFFQVLKFRT